MVLELEYEFDSSKIAIDLMELMDLLVLVQEDIQVWEHTGGHEQEMATTFSTFVKYGAGHTVMVLLFHSN